MKKYLVLILAATSVFCTSIQSQEAKDDGKAKGGDNPLLHECPEVEIRDFLFRVFIEKEDTLGSVREVLKNGNLKGKYRVRYLKLDAMLNERNECRKKLGQEDWLLLIEQVKSIQYDNISEKLNSAAKELVKHGRKSESVISLLMKYKLNRPGVTGLYSTVMEWIEAFPDLLERLETDSEQVRKGAKAILHRVGRKKIERTVVLIENKLPDEFPIEAEGILVEGRKEGVWTFYNTRGNLWRRGKYWHGMKEGLWRVWLYGHLSKEAMLHLDKFHGVVKSYPVSTMAPVAYPMRPRVVANYENGILHGKFATREVLSGNVYYETGKFLNGQKHGKWEFRQNDVLIQTGKYRKGRKHGEWIGYDKKGGITRKSVFHDGKLQDKQD
jgi:antitoxin component YwqK of YwqJK toxin-antitoxin module